MALCPQVKVEYHSLNWGSNCNETDKELFSLICKYTSNCKEHLFAALHKSISFISIKQQIYYNSPNKKHKSDSKVFGADCLNHSSFMVCVKASTSHRSAHCKVKTKLKCKRS